MGGRRDQVLDAGLDVLGREGARGLTHQAVDRAAGVPAGTTSNSFRSRAALLHGVLARQLERDRADWDRVLRRPLRDGDDLVTALAELARHAAGPGLPRTRARFALFLEAAGQPDLAALLAEGRAAVLAWGTEQLAALGVPEPAARCARLLAQLDGYVLHRLAFPADDGDPAAAFRAILAGP